MERYRISEFGSVYFLTYSVVEWLPIFIDEASCRIITDSLTYCCRHKQLCVNAFVVMPTHIHLIAFDAEFDSNRLRHTLADFRKFTGRTLSDSCAIGRPGCFAEVLRKEAVIDRERRFWQPSRHPEVIDTERFWQQKCDYLHENPCRKGLVRRATNWRFSSAEFYATDGKASADITVTPVTW